jgi:hypothetical protein
MPVEDVKVFYFDALLQVLILNGLETSNTIRPMFAPRPPESTPD